MSRRVFLADEAHHHYRAMPDSVRHALAFPTLDVGEQLAVRIVGEEFARLGKWYCTDLDRGPAPERAKSAMVTAARLAALLIEHRGWSAGWLAYRRGERPRQHPEVLAAAAKVRHGADANARRWELDELRRSGVHGSELVTMCLSLSSQEGAHLAIFIRDYGEPHFIALAQKVDALRNAVERLGPRRWPTEPATHVRGVLGVFRELMGPALAEAKYRDAALLRGHADRRDRRLEVTRR